MQYKSAMQQCRYEKLMPGTKEKPLSVKKGATYKLVITNTTFMNKRS
ncbi:MAG: hypothetical protein ABI091_06140 [Ferruginibacter sp.]